MIRTRIPLCYEHQSRFQVAPNPVDIYENLDEKYSKTCQTEQYESST
jgi:hypothetical protein